MALKDLYWAWYLDNNLFEERKPGEAPSEQIVISTSVEDKLRNYQGGRAEIVVDNTATQENFQARRFRIESGTSKENATPVFRGLVYDEKVIKKKKLRLTAHDKLHDFKKTFFNKSYNKNIDPEAGEVSAIFKDIVETFGDFQASVVSTGTGDADVVLDNFVAKDAVLLQKLRELADYVNYIFYHDYENDVIRFEPPGDTTFNKALVTRQNILGIPSWEDNVERMVNKVKIKGARQEDTREDTFTGDGSTTDFDLSFEPFRTKVTVDGTLQKRGLEGSSESFDYKVDRELQRVEFENAPSNGSNIVVEYTAKVPAPVIVEDRSSQQSTGLTRSETFTFEDIRTVEDARRRGESIINRVGGPVSTTQVTTEETGVQAGMDVDYKDTINPDRTGTYTARRVIYRYPDNTAKVDLSEVPIELSEFIDNIQTRVQRLEEQEQVDPEIVRRLIKLSSDLKITHRDLIIFNRDVSNTDTLIWGHPTLGVWGQQNWGEQSSLPSKTRAVVIQGDNTFRELLYDQDYIAGSTTASIDTNAQEATIAFDETYETRPISKGYNVDSFTARVNASQNEDNVVLEYSTDGGNTYNDATLDDTTTVSSDTSNGLCLRLTNSASSGGNQIVLTPSTDSTGITTAAAITVELEPA